MPNGWLIAAVITLAIIAIVQHIAIWVWRNRYIKSKSYGEMYREDFFKLHNERHNVARLSSIERNGRINIFHFVRNGETFTIETMGLLGDDVNDWNMKAGISSHAVG